MLSLFLMYFLLENHKRNISILYYTSKMPKGQQGEKIFSRLREDFFQSNERNPTCEGCPTAANAALTISLLQRRRGTTVVVDEESGYRHTKVVLLIRHSLRRATFPAGEGLTIPRFARINTLRIAKAFGDHRHCRRFSFNNKNGLSQCDLPIFEFTLLCLKNWSSFFQCNRSIYACR